jgi:hypothetical protein
LNLRGALELALAGLLLGLEAQRLDLLLQIADAIDGLAFLGPARAQAVICSRSSATSRSTSCSAPCCVSVSRFSAARSISSDVAWRSN